MSKDEYISAFRGMVTDQLDKQAVRATISVLDTRTPQAIFDELDRLRESGMMQGKDFEKMLTDFFWLFCY